MMKLMEPIMIAFLGVVVRRHRHRDVTCRSSALIGQLSADH